MKLSIVFLVITLLASKSEAFDPTIVTNLLPNVTLGQMYQMSRLLLNSPTVVSKIERIINLNNFYPLYSNYGLDDFLNCTAKQLANLQTINLCISRYSQFAALLNQTVLLNTGYYFGKSLGPAFGELLQSAALRSWLVQKGFGEGARCFFTQALNPISTVSCMRNFTNLAGFVSVISNQNSTGFLTYFKLFLNDNIGKWLIQASAKSTVNTDILGSKLAETFDCIMVQTTNECLQSTGLNTFVSERKTDNLKELIEATETVLVSAGLPAGSFDLMKAKLTAFDQTATDILAKNSSPINKSSFLIISTIIFLIKVF